MHHARGGLQGIGDDMQFVEVELDPGEATVAEAGGMMYMEDGIEMETISVTALNNRVVLSVHLWERGSGCSPANRSS